MDFDLSDESSGEGESSGESESEDEAEALIMKSRMMFAKSVVSKKRHAAPAKKALTKKVLTKKTQAAPAALPADQCFTEMLTGVQSPACKTSMDAWTDYCRANPADAGCVELRAKEAKIVADHFKNMSFAKKTQDAPAFDVKCADSDLLTRTEECWD